MNILCPSIVHSHDYQEQLLESLDTKKGRNLNFRSFCTRDHNKSTENPRSEKVRARVSQCDLPFRKCNKPYTTPKVSKSAVIASRSYTVKDEQVEIKLGKFYQAVLIKVIY